MLNSDLGLLLPSKNTICESKCQIQIPSIIVNVLSHSLAQKFHSSSVTLCPEILRIVLYKTSSAASDAQLAR